VASELSSRILFKQLATEGTIKCSTFTSASLRHCVTASLRENASLASVVARWAAAPLILLSLESRISAQTWTGPWDWTSCHQVNPICTTQGVFAEFSHAAPIPTGLYRGKVLMWHREIAYDPTSATPCEPTYSTYGYIFDPLAPNDLILIKDAVPSDIFCASSTWDPNGRPIVVGGNRQAPALLNNAYRFHPGSLGVPIGSGCGLHIVSRVWQALYDMRFPRFYPTIIGLTKETIQYDASTTYCTNIVGGAHLVLGGPNGASPSYAGVTNFELLPYGSKQWACSVSETGSGSAFYRIAEYMLYTDSTEVVPPLGQPGNLYDGKLDSYPRAFQLSNGDVLTIHDADTPTLAGAVANHPQQCFALRLNQGGASKFESWRVRVDGSNPGPDSDRNYGTALLMHMAAFTLKDRVLALGGAAGGGQPVNSVQEFIPGPAGPTGGSTVGGKWITKANLKSPRTFSGAVALPDGKILMSSGAFKLLPNEEPVAEPEIYDPGPSPTALGSSVLMPRGNPVSNPAGTPAGPTQRLYHSFSVLLPDGSVFIAGGEAHAQQVPGFAIGPYSGEIFQPPYMPQTTGLDMPYIDSVGSEQPMSPQGLATPFAVTVENCKPEAFTVVGVVLTRPAAVTHFFDNDQRYIELNILSQVTSPSAATLTVRSLEDHLGPPGWYMLWVIVTPAGSTQRLPTHAEFVRFY